MGETLPDVWMQDIIGVSVEMTLLKRKGRVSILILSVSRRTDIPNYYAQWFCSRIREGYLFVRNPVNPHQISRIDLSPDLVDCIVFWSKNPRNMMGHLDELADYSYYFQFTLTGYGRDIEPNLPDKRRVLVPLFQELSEKIGKQRVIWRYDPILINERYTFAYHRKAFAEIAASLKGCTDRVVISFLDFYGKTRRNTRNLRIQKPDTPQMLEIAAEFAEIAKRNQMRVESCAEELNLEEAGVLHGSCIDRRLIEEILGCSLKGRKDKGQRPACGCMESVEVGVYDSCPNGCRYCYANENFGRVEENLRKYDVNSPLLCGSLGAGDVVTERKMRTLRDPQMNFNCILPVKKI